MATLLQIIQFFDENGDPLSEGKLYFYEAGTSTPKDTWKDQAESAASPNPVELDTEGRVGKTQAGVWVRGSYKLIVKDQNDVTVAHGEFDDLNMYDQRDWTGLTASIADLNSTTTTATIVSATTAITLAQRNQTILCDASGGAFDINLPSAVSAGDTFRIFIKKIDLSSNNIVTIKTPGIETIDESTEYKLFEANDEIGLQCDGSNYYSISLDKRKSVITFTAATYDVDLNEEYSILIANASVAATVNLPASSTLGSGYRITIKNFSPTNSPVTVQPNGIETIDSQSSLEIVDRDVAYTLINNGGGWYIDSSHNTGITFDYPPKYLEGFLYFRDLGDVDHDINILPGVCRDASDSVNINQALSLIKKTDASWIEGTNQGGFPSSISLSPNTWYYLFKISKNNGVNDGGFDTTLNASNLLTDAAPFGYTRYRRIGAVLTDASSNIESFIMRGNGVDKTIVWSTKVSDFSDTSTTGLQTRTIRTPIGLEPMATIVAVIQNPSPTIWATFQIYSIAGAGETPQTTPFVNASIGPAVGGLITATSAQLDVIANASSEIRYTTTNLAGDNVVLDVYTQGYIDNL